MNKSKIKEQLIISAILYKYIDEYLMETAIKRIDKTYYGDNWEIEIIEREPRKLRELTIPVNHVIFRAPEDICDDLVLKFRMKFMSAGA
jgi:hypothetical protein